MKSALQIALDTGEAQLISVSRSDLYGYQANAKRANGGYSVQHGNTPEEAIARLLRIDQPAIATPQEDMFS